MIEKVESTGEVGEVTYLVHRTVVREDKSMSKVVLFTMLVLRIKDQFEPVFI